MKTASIWIALTAGLGWVQNAAAATVAVDWLQLSGASASGFSLVDDEGAPLGGGKLTVDKGFSVLPSARRLNGDFWAGDTGFADSVSGDASVGSILFRVAPLPGPGGGAVYEIEFTVPQDRELVLMVGELYRSALGSTEAVLISAFTDDGPAAVSLAGIEAWSSGTNTYDQDLEWDESTGALSTVDGADGDSQMAFFRIGPLSGLNPRILLSIPNGYAGGVTGDSLTIALGVVVVPEPSAAALAGIVGVFACCLRRRRDGLR